MTQVAKYTTLAALFLITLIPLYVARDLFFPFITGKAFAFRILVEVAFVSWIALAAMDRRYRPQFSWVLALFAGFTLWMFIADLFAVNAHKALWSNFERMDGFVTLIHVFLFFLVAGTVLTVDKLWRRWWLTFLTVAALVCGYALLQLGGGIQINQGGVRVDGTFGNAIYLAVYLMFAAFISVWLALESKGWLRYGLLTLAAVSVIILFNTATRGAIIATVAGAGLAALLMIVRSGKQGRRIALGAFVALLIALGGFFLVKDQPVVAEHPIWGRIASISLGELSVRFTLWSMAVEGIRERPLIGYGQEGYNYIFNGYYRPELVTQEPWFDRAHSAYIDWLVAGGIPALLLFVALLLAAAVILVRTPGLTVTERVMLGSVLAAYALQAVVVFDNLFSYVPLAAILAYLHGKRAQPIRAIDRLPELKGSQSGAIVLPVAAAAILFLILTVNAPGMRQAHHLVYAVSPLPGGPTQNLEHFKQAIASHGFANQELSEQLVNAVMRIGTESAVPAAVKNEYAQLTIAQLEEAIKQAPKDARLLMQAALLYRTFGDYPRALAAAEAAEALSPNRQLMMLERATILTLMDRRPEAVALIEQMYALSPASDEFTARTAAALIIAGENTRAQELLMERFGTTVIDHNALVAAYAETKQFDALIEILRLQAEHRPDSAEVQYRLATGYLLAGRPADARREVQAAMVRFPATAAQGKALLAAIDAQY